jgi:hypothetical protein
MIAMTISSQIKVKAAAGLRLSARLTGTTGFNAVRHGRLTSGLSMDPPRLRGQHRSHDLRPAFADQRERAIEVEQHMDDREALSELGSKLHPNVE